MSPFKVTHTFLVLQVVILSSTSIPIPEHPQCFIDCIDPRERTLSVVRSDTPYAIRTARRSWSPRVNEIIRCHLTTDHMLLTCSAGCRAISLITHFSEALREMLNKDGDGQAFNSRAWEEDQFDLLNVPIVHPMYILVLPTGVPSLQGGCRAASTSAELDASRCSSPGRL